MKQASLCSSIATVAESGGRQAWRAIWAGPTASTPARRGGWPECRVNGAFSVFPTLETRNLRQSGGFGGRFRLDATESAAARPRAYYFRPSLFRVRGGCGELRPSARPWWGDLGQWPGSARQWLRAARTMVFSRIMTPETAVLKQIGGFGGPIPFQTPWKSAAACPTAFFRFGRQSGGDASARPLAAASGSSGESAMCVSHKTHSPRFWRMPHSGLKRAAAWR